jgi:hypothetical protein
MKKLIVCLLVLGLTGAICSCQTTKFPTGEIVVKVDNAAVVAGVQQAILAAQTIYDLYTQDQERRAKIGEEKYQRELARQQMYIESLKQVLDALQKVKPK